MPDRYSEPRERITRPPFTEDEVADVMTETMPHFDDGGCDDSFVTGAEAMWRKLRPCIEALEEIEREINPDRMRETGHEPDPSRIWDEARFALANLYRETE